MCVRVCLPTCACQVNLTPCEESSSLSLTFNLFKSRKKSNRTARSWKQDDQSTQHFTVLWPSVESHYPQLADIESTSPLVIVVLYCFVLFVLARTFLHRSVDQWSSSKLNAKTYRGKGRFSFQKWRKTNHVRFPSINHWFGLVKMPPLLKARACRFRGSETNSRCFFTFVIFQPKEEEKKEKKRKEGRKKRKREGNSSVSRVVGACWLLNVPAKC